MNKQKNNIVSNLFWKFGERILAQGISFLVSLVLARLLLPSEYGTVALVLVFINLANVFVSNGLGEALIQKKNANDADFSTMFFCSLGLSIVLYVGRVFGAPLIANYYQAVTLVSVLRVLALRLPLAAINTIQHAYVAKHMQFKKFFFSTLGGTLASAIVGISMAYHGFGIWALVGQYLSNCFIDTVVLFFTVDWRPRLMFSLLSVKQLLPFGWKLMAAGFISSLYGELRNLVIGKVYSTEDLAFYNKGNHFPSLTVTNVDTSISSVLFPAMSSINNDPNHLRALTRKSMRMSSYVVFPMMMGMCAVGETMIRFLLTDKWIGCVPFLRLSCIYWMIQPLQTANAQAIKACGRSDIYLKLETAKKIIGVSLIFVTMRMGVMAVVFSNLLVAAISIIMNIYPNKKLIGYGYTDQFKDVFPALFLSSVMGAAVWGIYLLLGNSVYVLILQLISGAAIYVGLSLLTHNDSFGELLKIVKREKGDA